MMALSRTLSVIPSWSACRSIPLTLESGKVVSLLPRSKTKLHTSHKDHILKVSNCSPAAVCGLNVPMQVRFSHTDVTSVPDFTKYRPDSTKSPTSRASDSEMQRKVFGYTMMFAGAVVATTAAKYTVKTFLMPLGPTAKTLAEASTEVALGNIPEGKNIVVKWRNKPLFVRHRTAEEISRERAVAMTQLRDPETDESRVQVDKWLICLGVCTHLGCVPLAHAGDFPGGYYCPCHGSHYDASGRIRKGPAPANLPVPEYKFLDDNTVVVG